MRAWWRHEPSWMRYYDPAHATQALLLMVGIVEAFDQLARSRGQIPLFIVLPDSRSFTRFLDTAQWPYETLLRAAASKGLPIYNLGPEMTIRLGNRSICGLFIIKEGTKCAGHYNAAGNCLVADLVYAYIEKHGLLPNADERRPLGQ